MGDISLHSLYAILPELYLCVMAMFLLLVAAFQCKRVCGAMLFGTLFSLGGTAWFLWSRLHQPAVIAFNGMFTGNGFTAFAQLLILGSTALVVLLSSGWMQDGEHGRAWPSELLVLMLFATLGMLLMVDADDLLPMYLALEMSSLPLYVLAAFARDHSRSSEAGLKYFLLGALASGMMLFGISLVYGFSGTTGFEPLATLFLASHAASKGIVVGMILIIIGFCFKISAVPFHMWTPDVYEGAPTPVTTFFATAPKVAALALFTRLLLHPFLPLIGEWRQVIIFAAVASMLVGALAAIMQTNIKRLLAYSSIGHVGFMLMGLAAGSIAGAQAVLIYLAIYIVMSAGAFGCVLLMRRDGQYVERISDLAGLAQTRPAFAAAMAIFMFSLAGIPPLAGFFGKLYIVLAVVGARLTWLAVVGVLTSVIGAYYYLRVVKVMYLDPPAEPFNRAIPCLVRTGLLIATGVTLLFFLWPTPLVAGAKTAAEALLH